jgi:ribonuclease P protein component
MRQLGRLRRAEEYRRVRRLGRQVMGQAGILYVAPNLCGETRVGVQASRRLGSAVRRNRARRRVREALRALAGQLAVGVDLVIVPRPAALAMEFAALREDLGGMLAAAGALTRGSHSWESAC